MLIRRRCYLSFTMHPEEASKDGKYYCLVFWLAARTIGTQTSRSAL